MDTRQRHASSLDKAFPAESRQETASAATTRCRDAAATVTADRSGRVVQPSTGQLSYEADPDGHRIVARFADGSVAFAFGRQGSRSGQFDTPLHVAAVSPAFAGEPQPANGLNGLLTPWLAVADYGNHRIQFFECDGAFVGEIELESTNPPCHLAWRAPALEVSTLEGQTVRVHVAAALLLSRSRETRHEAQAPSDAGRASRIC